MSLRIPSFTDMLTVARSRGRLSDAPDQWEDSAAMWRLAAGGGDTGYDLSGYRHHGTLAGTGTHWTASKRGMVWQGNGTDDWMDTVDLAELNSVSAFTIALAFKRAAAGNNDNLFRKTAGAAGNIYGWFQSNDYLYTRVYDGVDEGVGSFSFGTSTDWHDYYAVFDGSGVGNAGRLKVCMDGAPVVLNFSGTVPATTGDYSGANFECPPSVDPFGGLLSDIRVYTRAKTAAEVYEIYADPSAAWQLRKRVHAVGSVVTHGAFRGAFSPALAGAFG